MMKPVTFRLVPESEFSAAQLEEYPVWAEYHDPEELEEIVAWGVDAAWLEEEIAAQHREDDHAVYPLLQVNPFPARTRIFIKARFQTPFGQQLSGYIVDEEASPAIGIFYDDSEFVFNRNLREECTADIDKLQKLLTLHNDPLFPLSYTTDFTNDEGRAIEGVFDFDD